MTRFWPRATTPWWWRNHYFPIDDPRTEFLDDSVRHTVCPWKGEASYYRVVVDGQRNVDAAWYYPRPSSAASQITGRVAFWREVKVTIVVDGLAQGSSGWSGSLCRSVV